MPQTGSQSPQVTRVMIRWNVWLVCFGCLVTATDGIATAGATGCNARV